MNLGITDSPAALRASTPGWRDPRLWIGVAIVAASVVVGARVIGTSDQTVPVWATSGALGRGHTLHADDLVVRRVRFEDAEAAASYFPGDRQLPADLRLSRPVGAGELLPRTAVDAATPGDVREVPVAVAPDQVPAAVGVGDLVDVYVRSDGGQGLPVVAGVNVVAAPRGGSELGSDGTRMLVLAMSPEESQRYFSAIAASDQPSLTLVGRG